MTAPASRLQPPQKPLLLCVAVLAVSLAVSAGSNGWKQPVLFLIGILFGATLYHASFGFASAYRDMFVKGDVRGVWLTDTTARPVATEWVSPNWVGR
jgi:hypothetical protein